MKRLRPFGWFALVLLGICFPPVASRAQSMQPTNENSAGPRCFPAKPGGGPDRYAQFKTDPLARRALHQHARLDAQLRQKQVQEATELLLRIARDLRAEIAANPDTIRSTVESERLQQILKLARFIREREKWEDPMTEELAKAGVSQ